jgi:hypothetical protein
VNHFLFDLAQRGAGLAPIVTAQPDIQHYFPSTLRTTRTPRLEDLLVGGTMSERTIPGITKGGRPEGVPGKENVAQTPPPGVEQRAKPEGAPGDGNLPEISPSGTVASAQSPLVERPEPQHPRQRSAPRLETDTVTARERKPRLDRPNRPEPKPEAISTPRESSEQSSPSANPRAEEAAPLHPAAEAKVEPAEPPSSIGLVPRIRRVSGFEPVVAAEPVAQVPDAASLRHSTDLREGLPAQRTHGPRMFPLSEKSGTESATPQPVHVRIGPIEVRATTPPAAPPPAPSTAPVPTGFDDYAAIRSYMSWERR